MADRSFQLNFLKVREKWSRRSIDLQTINCSIERLMPIINKIHFLLCFDKLKKKKQIKKKQKFSVRRQIKLINSDRQFILQ